MMATVPHVTSGLGLKKFQADGFLLTRVYTYVCGERMVSLQQYLPTCFHGGTTKIFFYVPRNPYLCR